LPTDNNTQGITMKKRLKSTFLGLAMASLLTPVSSVANDADEAIAHGIEVRQSVMVLVRDNLGDIVEMIKGEREWDLAAFQKRAADLAAVTSMDMDRGYVAGSFAKDTRAKAEIENNREEFGEMLAALSSEAAKLSVVSQGGDKGAMAGQFKELVGTCKSCHKKYKNKEKN
jgi:cytochrome c556